MSTPTAPAPAEDHQHTGTDESRALLVIEDVVAGYGPIEVLHGISLRVDQGEVVVVLGANGAGKTTALRAICGSIATRGHILLDGAEIVGRDPATVARLGVAHVPQGRGTFAELSVEDNLRVGAYTRPSGEVAGDVAQWLDVFPRLAERRTQLAGSLSGGEQQMLALARGLMSRPRLLLLDEPSQGLAPLVVRDLFARLAGLRKELGTTMLLVEQNATLALDLADRGYVLEAGRVVMEGSAEHLQADDSVRRAYLGY